MAKYVIHAARPNELRTVAGDDPHELAELAEELRELGFTAWLYERHPSAPGVHVLREWRP